MKQYNGRIQRLNVLKGRMLKKLKGLKISILPINTHPTAEIKPNIKYRATWDKGISFGGMVKRLDVIFRFLSIKERIINKHEAKAISAPAVDVEADSAIRASKEAKAISAPVVDADVNNAIKAGKKIPLSAHPATEAVTNHNELVGLFARLSACIRAVCKYNKDQFMSRKAELKSAVGTVANCDESVPKFKRTSKAIAAESESIKIIYNNAETCVKAVGSSSPTQSVPEIENTLTEEHTATANTVVAVDVGTDSVPNVTHSAKMATWIEPVVIDGVLILRQVYSAIQEDDILGVE